MPGTGNQTLVFRDDGDGRDRAVRAARACVWLTPRLRRARVAGKVTGLAFLGLYWLTRNEEVSPLFLGLAVLNLVGSNRAVATHNAFKAIEKSQTYTLPVIYQMDGAGIRIDRDGARCWYAWHAVEHMLEYQHGVTLVIDNALFDIPPRVFGGLDPDVVIETMRDWLAAARARTNGIEWIGRPQVLPANDTATPPPG